MSCTASRIFLKASCLLINFPSKYTVSSSLSDAASCGDSEEVSEVNGCFAVDGVHGKGGVFKGVVAGRGKQDSLEPKEAWEGEGRRGGVDDNVSGSSWIRGEKELETSTL